MPEFLVTAGSFPGGVAPAWGLGPNHRAVESQTAWSTHTGRDTSGSQSSHRTTQRSRPCWAAWA